MLAQAKSSDAVKRGENIILGGLGIQILFFGLFMIAILVFHWRIHSKPTRQSLELVQPWRKFVWVLYATSILIMVRSMFRVAEYVEGRIPIYPLYACRAQKFWLRLMVWRHSDRIVTSTTSAG